VRETPPEAVFTDVEMVSTGREPRVTLRIARWSGLRYRVFIEASGTAGVEGLPPVAGPTVSMKLDYEVLRGSADPIIEHRDGGIVRMVDERVVLDDVSVRLASLPPHEEEALNRAFNAYRGTSFTQLVTESAAIASMRTELLGGWKPPPDVLAALDAGLEMQRRFPFRFPPVPVGIGARWRLREQIEINGATVFQIAEMTLRAVDSDTAAVRIVLRQEAPRQEVPHPLQPGDSAMLEQYRGDGEGELTVDRLTASPLQGRLTTTARLSLSGDVGGVPQKASLIGVWGMQATGAIVADDEADGGGEPH
jgi:hypothetical protein